MFAATAFAQWPGVEFTVTTSANPAHVGQPVGLVGTLSRESPGFDGYLMSFFRYDPVYDDPHVLCSYLPTTQISATRSIATCTAIFDTPGAKMVGGQYGGLPGTVQFPESSLLIQTVIAADAFDADRFELTGSWFTPGISAQGVLVEVYPDLRGAGLAAFFGGWMTYGADGAPRWLTLQGNASTPHGATYDLGIYETTGGAFAQARAVSTTAMGSATWTFYDCGHAAMLYRLDDGRSGTIAFSRLTASTGCDAPSAAPVESAEFAGARNSGAWFDPSIDGQGIVFDVVPAQRTFFGAWYTFAPASGSGSGAESQRWFTLQTNDYAPGSDDVTGVPIYAAAGGVFDGPQAASVERVGTADIAVPSCRTMTIAYSFDTGELAGAAGSLDLRRVVAPPGCE